MTETLTVEAPTRYMHYVNGSVVAPEMGLLQLTWRPDDPHCVHVHLDLPKFTVDAEIDTHILEMAMVTYPNGKFTQGAPFAPVGIAYKPGLFGVKLDMEDGSRILGAVAPFAVGRVEMFAAQLAAVLEAGKELIDDLVDAELEALLRGYSAGDSLEP